MPPSETEAADNSESTAPPAAGSPNQSATARSGLAWTSCPRVQDAEQLAELGRLPLDDTAERMDVAELDRMVERREWTDSAAHQAFRAAGDYVLYSWKPDSIVRLFKRFYSDGRIKQKGLVIANGDGFIGPHYRFAEDGTRSIDLSNRLFEFTLDELALCLRSHDIPVLYRPGPNGVQTSIVMRLTDEGPRWRVSSLRRDGLVEDLTIDGTNGALLAQTTRNAPEDDG